MIYLGDKYTNSAPLDYYNSHKDENQFSEHTRFELEQALKAISDFGFEVGMYYRML
jgi:hypothetical protein